MTNEWTCANARMHARNASFYIIYEMSIENRNYSSLAITQIQSVRCIASRNSILRAYDADIASFLFNFNAIVELHLTHTESGDTFRLIIFSRSWKVLHGIYKHLNEFIYYNKNVITHCISWKKAVHTTNYRECTDLLNFWNTFLT